MDPTQRGAFPPGRNHCRQWSEVWINSPPAAPCTCFRLHRGPGSTTKVDRLAVDLMENMLVWLGSAEGGFLFLHIFLCQLPPLVRAALANCPCLDDGDFRGLAEEADRVFLSSRCLSIHGVASDTPQPAAEDEDLAMVAATCASSTSSSVAGLGAVSLHVRSKQRETPKPALSSSRW